MKTHTISVGFYTVYNIKVEAETDEEAVEKINNLYRAEGLEAVLALGRDMPPCGEEDVLIQHEGEE